MGTLKKREWSEKKIQNILRKYFLDESTKKYEITNLFIYNWESDYLAITRSNVVHEVEIKISRADFFNDAKHKQDKFKLFESRSKPVKESMEAGVVPYGNPMPSYFYYAVPEGLIKPEEVPDYAGLLYVQPWGVELVKKPTKLDGSFDVEQMRLVDKFYYNMLAWQRKYEEVADSAEEIKDLKRQIKAYHKDIMMYEEMLGKKDWEIDDLKEQLKKVNH